VFVSLGIQQAMHKLHTVICDLSGCTIFFHIISSMARFLKNKFTENKMCVLIVFTTSVWNISHSKKNWPRYDQNCILVFT